MFNPLRQFLLTLVLAALVITGLTAIVRAQTGPETASGTAAQTGTGFTFQGQLRDGSAPVNATCDIQAGLWNTETGGAQVGTTQTVSNVDVADGRFTITLNPGGEFGETAFNGQVRWLQIAVRCPAGSGSYAILQPRQPLTAAPYALSLAPGAVISGSIGAPTYAMLSLSNFDPIGVGLRIPDSKLASIFIDRAGTNGIFVGNSDGQGIYVNSVGANGFHVQSAGNYGLWVGLANQDGINVAGNNLAGAFYGAVQITGGCTGCTLANFGVNTGQSPLKPGDVVVVTGSQISRVDSTPMLMEVMQANGQGAVVGVVMGRAEEVTVKNPRPNELGKRLIPREGLAQPGEFVTIVTYGLAPVRVGTANASFTIGQRLTAGENGMARSLQTVEVNGVTLNEAAPTLGTALESGDADGDGLVWVLVNPN